MQRMILRATKAKTGVVEQLLDDEKIDQAGIARELAEYYELSTVNVGEFSVSETALKFISKTMADKHGVLPFAVSESADQVTVAVYNPEAAQSVIDSLKTATGKRPNVQVAPRRWLEGAIRHFYFQEAWAEAPEHRTATREVAAVARELGLGGDSSSEIVLDEVVVPPAPKVKKAAPRSKDPAQTPLPPPLIVLDDSAPPPEPRRKRAPEEAPARRKSAAPASESEGHDAALDEFDAFLDHATGWGGAGNRSGIPGWDQADSPADANPFAREDDGWHDPPSAGGFSLFDEKSEAEGLNLREVVDRHDESIAQLRREIQQQREIITALVDALVEAGVVSKRDIKHRVKRK